MFMQENYSESHEKSKDYYPNVREPNELRAPVLNRKSYMRNHPTTCTYAIHKHPLKYKLYNRQPYILQTGKNQKTAGIDVFPDIWKMIDGLLIEEHGK